MAKPMEQPVEKGVSALDIRIMISVGICCLTATVLKSLGVLFTLGEMHMEVIQTLTSCISCLLVCQDTTAISAKAGKNRLIITAIGGLVGMAVAWIETLVGQPFLLVLLVALGVLLTLILCKFSGVPYINARIGGVTFVLVACTLSGTARMWYALFRFISTLYGAFVVVVVTWVFERVVRKNAH